MVELSTMDGRYSLHRFSPDEPIPTQILSSDWYTVSRTSEELSVVCREGLITESPNVSPDWAGLKVTGPLDFSQIGIIAGLSQVLASAGISIFAVSTFDTDYLFVAANQLESAVQTLKNADYTVLS
ncbi:MAG: ACT domain-containing protein [Bacteroidetes bacterium]|nr:ACT domain-containing protein [Bacteroidota bacterium]